MDRNQVIVWSVVGVLVLAGLGYWVYETQKTPEPATQHFITNFEECADAGYPVAESYPRECRTPEGVVYVEEMSADNVPTDSIDAGANIDVNDIPSK